RVSVSRQKCFLVGAVPTPLKSEKDLVDRDAANVADWYAPWAKKFLRLPADFITHATKYAPCKRLPRGWSVTKPKESAIRLQHALRVRPATAGSLSVLISSTSKSRYSFIISWRRQCCAQPTRPPLGSLKPATQSRSLTTSSLGTASISRAYQKM